MLSEAFEFLFVPNSVDLAVGQINVLVQHVSADLLAAFQGLEQLIAQALSQDRFCLRVELSKRLKVRRPESFLELVPESFKDSYFSGDGATCHSNTLVWF